MARAQLPLGLVVASLFLACGGGGSSPTEPEPVPDSLEGTWRGQLSGSDGGGAFSCPLEVTLNPLAAGAFFGSWRADCPGGEIGGLASGFESLVSTAVALSGHGATEPEPGVSALGICGWQVVGEIQGSELAGTWEPPEDCGDVTLAGGPLSLRYKG